MRLCSPKVDHLPFKQPHRQATSKSAGSALTSKWNSLCEPTEACWRSMKPQNQSTQSVRQQRNTDNWCCAMLLNTNLEIGFQSQGGETQVWDKVYFLSLIVFALFRKRSFSLLKTLTHIVWRLPELLFQDRPVQARELDTRSYSLRRDTFLVFFFR